MRPELKQEMSFEKNQERAGVVLMDASYHPLAIDSGATSVLISLSRERGGFDPACPLAEMVSRELEELMLSFQGEEGVTMMTIRIQVCIFPLTARHTPAASTNWNPKMVLIPLLLFSI